MSTTAATEAITVTLHVTVPAGTPAEYVTRTISDGLRAVPEGWAMGVPAASAAVDAKSRLLECAEWYEDRATTFGETAAFWHRHFAGECRKVADSL